MKHSLHLITLAAALAAAPAAFAGDAAHWGYKGHAGPAHWAELDAEHNGACQLGKAQSPIDIRGAKKAKNGELPAIDFGYTAGAAEVINNGHTIQVSLADGGTARVPAGEYKLVQFHFHTPSEERVDGKAYPLVAHFVHVNADKQLAVVGVLFKQGKANAALQKVFDAMPAHAGEKAALEGGFDPASLLPAGKAYWAFDGSLTTPPCSEGVKWQVLQQPVELSRAQLQAFRKLYPMNARPVQPLNGRVVLSAR